MALKAIVFDVGGTLIDETHVRERAADAADVPRFTPMGVFGGPAARGEHHENAWDLLGVDPEEARSGCAGRPDRDPETKREVPLTAHEIADVGDRVDKAVAPARAVAEVFAV